MNHEKTPPQHLDIIWDSDGSLDGVIGLLYFLQHPDVSVRALTISCG
jgi:inosine-uridine nucleoside N-ribohydrolase